MTFWISRNDFGDYGSETPAGEYVLCQFANFDAGFVRLLDVSGLSLWALRSALAEAYGYVHYYSQDGTFTFKPRLTSGSAAFIFSSANGNLFLAGSKHLSRGFESVINDVTTIPYDIAREERTSDITKSGPLVTDGAMTDVSVSPNPDGDSQWRLVFTSKTAYSLYKMVGTNYDIATSKATGATSTVLRDILDGTFLAILPEHFEGAFQQGDTFTWWVFQPQESLQQLDSRNQGKAKDSTSIAKYRRRSRDFNNRFVLRPLLMDFLGRILAWNATCHEGIEIEVAYDPAYAPLLRCSTLDTGLGYDAGDLFQIMGVGQTFNRTSTKLTLIHV
jgi:hypothetical protein